MPEAALHRFNVKDYYRMGELGLLPPDARVELVNGNIIDLSSVSPMHGGVVIRLNRLFHDCSSDGWLISLRNPVHLDDYSEPVPDLMLLKKAADDYCEQHPCPKDVFLLVEVSDSTLETDREVKLPVYARAGIAEVWIVDLTSGALEVYRDPHLTAYTNIRILHDGDSAAPVHFPDAVIEVSKLLRH
jgi:Uma2 family endonuclease